LLDFLRPPSSSVVKSASTISPSTGPLSDAVSASPAEELEASAAEAY
jgi:hypothetical protein